MTGDTSSAFLRVIGTAVQAAAADGQTCHTGYLLWALLQEPEGPHRDAVEALERRVGANEARALLQNALIPEEGTPESEPAGAPSLGLSSSARSPGRHDPVAPSPEPAS